MIRPTGPTPPRISARLAERIRAEIAAAGGLLPFDRFMDLALYAPGLGYYVAGAVKLGRDGDFVTAPEISPLFGRCLAAQCAEVLERLGGGDLLELGAGTGALAVEVLQALEHRDALPERYLILEPSPDLQERQQSLIRERIPHLEERCAWLTRLPRTLRGVVLANEVLDAMPVHRFSIRDDGGIDEVFVTERAAIFLEVTAPVRSPGLADAVAALQAEGFAQAPGYGSEINLRLPPWLKALGLSLDAGLVLLVDYGYPRAAYYQPDRTMGTLMCHLRHQAHDDPYTHIGLQDITAHVDFTAVAEAGVAAGFDLAGFTTQAHFLIGCGIDRILSDRPMPST
jgi:SAM-dependent MidA family methyltransferase